MTERRSGNHWNGHFGNYWFKRDRELSLEILDLKQKKLEKEKREKYNPEDIFKNKNNVTVNSNIGMPENNVITSLFEYKGFFTKLKTCIFKLLHINRKS